MMKSLESEIMKKEQIQELKKMVDDLEKKVINQRKWLQSHNTINFFVEDIRKEIHILNRLISRVIP